MKKEAKERRGEKSKQLGDGKEGHKDWNAV